MHVSMIIQKKKKYAIKCIRKPAARSLEDNYQKYEITTCDMNIKKILIF